MNGMPARPRLAISLFCAAFLAWPIHTAAQDSEDSEDDSLRCLNARSIRGTDVIDDGYIVFEIQGRRLFLNALPKNCKGLSKDRRFSYETFTRSLCANDKIRILVESAGRVYEGRSCSLGRFKPVTIEDLDAFVRERSATPGPQPVESADVEDVVKDES